MKAIVVLLALGVIGFLLVGGCSGQLTTWYTDSKGAVHVHCWAGSCPSEASDPAGMSLRGSDSAIMEDVLAINAAELSTNGDEANLSVFRLVDRASDEKDGQGDALIRQNLRPLAATITSEFPTARDRLLALSLRSTAGQSCRIAVVRMLAMTESVYRRVLDDLAANGAPAKIVSEVISGEHATSRSYMSDLKPCLAGLELKTRAAVKGVLIG
jgi:hypothetical protein